MAAAIRATFEVSNTQGTGEPAKMKKLCLIVCLTAYALACSAGLSQCPKQLYDPAIDQPSLNAINLKTDLIKGSVKSVPAGATVQLCVVNKSGAKNVTGQPIIGDGTFAIKVPEPLAVGDKVTVQVVVPGPPVTYGRESELITVPESCEASATAVSGQDPPTIKVTLVSPGKASVSGKFSSPKGKSIRICVDDAPIKDKPAIDSKGSFTVTGIAAKTAQKVSAQIVEVDPQGATQKIEAISSAVEVPASSDASLSGFRYIFIAGVEEASYSSLGLATEPFVQAYIEGNEHRYRFFKWTAPWGKIRLLAAPQPSTNGIGSTFTDPTGTITKQDFTKIGQAVDLIGGIQKFASGEGPDHTRVGLIAWAGTTTPLSSQDVAYEFKAPDVSTAECKQLLTRFTPATGYTPGLVADPTGKTCLTNNGTAVTDIAFANQDRSSFLFKWGAGVRLVGTQTCTGDRASCLPALAMLDATIGQDASVTRGLVRHFVAKADGVLPIAATKNFVYLFGSIYSRLERNQNYPSLILAAETNKPTLPNASVVVLPLQQPDRDFFRIGVGLNLSQVFSKFSGSSTDSPTADK